MFFIRKSVFNFFISTCAFICAISCAFSCVKPQSDVRFAKSNAGKNIAVLINGSLVPASIDPTTLAASDSRLAPIAKAFGRPLTDARQDIIQMSKSLEKIAYTTRPILIHNPTSEEATAQILKAANQLSQNDTLTVYITAHGRNSGDDFSVLMPGNQMLEAIRSSTNTSETAGASGRVNLSFRELAKTLAASRSKPIGRIVFIIDACESGRLTTLFSTKNDDNTKPKTVIEKNASGEYVQTVIPSKFVYIPATELLVFVSSGPKQSSFSSDSGSMFTRLLARSIRETTEPKNLNFNKLLDTVVKGLSNTAQKPMLSTFPLSLSDTNLIPNN